MTDAFIVSTARTGMGQSWVGGFNLTHPAMLVSAAALAAIDRVGLAPDEVADVVVGRVGNEPPITDIVRAPGWPQSAPLVNVNRLAASGLQSIASAAQRLIAGECDVVAAGGVESISGGGDAFDRLLASGLPPFGGPGIGAHRTTPPVDEQFAHRQGISPDRQQEFAARSRERAVLARRDGRLRDEIVPVATVMARIAPESGAFETVPVTVAADETIGLEPPGITWFSDGASVSVVMSEREVNRRGLVPIGRFAGFAVAGPDEGEMGGGVVNAVRRLLERTGLAVDDIDLWEIGEALADRVLFCQDRLGIADEVLNVDGGDLALGCSYGSSGSRMVGHGLIEAARRSARHLLVAIEGADGMGAAGLFEAR